MPPYPNQPYYNNGFPPSHQAGFNTAGVGQTVPISGYDSSAMPGLTNSSNFSTNESMQCSDNQFQNNYQPHYNQQGRQQQQPPNPSQQHGVFPQQQQQQEHQQLYPFFGAQQQQQQQQHQQQQVYNPPHGYPFPHHPYQQQQHQQPHQQEYLQPLQPWNSPSAYPPVAGGGLGASTAGTHAPMTIWMTPTALGAGAGTNSTLPLTSGAGEDSSAMPSLMMDDSRSAPNSEASTAASPPSPCRPPAVVAGQHAQPGRGGGGGGVGGVVGADGNDARKHQHQNQQHPQQQQPHQVQHNQLAFQQQQQQPQQQWQLHAHNLGEDPLVHLGLGPLDPDADYELTTVLNFFKPQARYELPPVPEFEFSQFTNRQMAFKGGNGQIRKVWWQPKGIHVILKSLIDKVVKPGRTTQEDLFNKEVLIMNRCNGHQNIVRFYGISTRSGTGQRDGERYMVMHYYEQGDLTSLLRRAYPTTKDKQVIPAEITLSWKEKMQLALDIALGLQHLFRNGFHHGDLHPKNVLIDTVKDDPDRRFRALLTDFGLSKVAQSNRDFSSQEVAGVWAFMAPERLPAKHPRFDVRCDIFALGVVSWQITSGHYPFGGSPTYLPGREKPVPGTPEGFVRFYQQAWSEQPDARQQSLDEVVSQLEGLIREVDGGSENNSHNGSRPSEPAGGSYPSMLSPPPQSGDCHSPSLAGASLSAGPQGSHYNAAAAAEYPSPSFSNYSMNTTSLSTMSTSTSSSMSTKTQSRPSHPNHPNNRPAPSIPGVKTPIGGRAQGGSGIPNQHGGNRPHSNSNAGRANLPPQVLQQLEDQRRYHQTLGQGYGFR
ncbi:hypothetical protein BGW42_008324 [Actinomortierella wolfii]|nr:hypothetical protein BGW42_008324 [Actinomortierella wolfii]